MEYIEIGKIINTHGIKGEVKIESWSDFDELRYEKGNVVYIEHEGEFVPVRVKSYREHKGFPLVVFEGYENINLVEPFKNCIILMDADDRQELEDGEYYMDELIGLDVFDEDGKKLGVLVDMEPTNGAQNNLRIEMEDGKTFLVPYVDAFVKDIDMDENRMVIHFEEGLL